MRAAQAQKVPIRIGVNGGSLEKDLLKKYGTATPEAMVESALRHIRILEDLDFTDIIISLKASDVHRTVAAYRLLAEKVDYPFHLGVTEAGTAFSGTIKSSIGLGILLHEGIGDTIRVSLAAEPQEEVRVAWEILKSLGLRTRGVTVVACPTCGRLDVDNFVEIVTEIERRLAHIRRAAASFDHGLRGERSGRSSRFATGHHLRPRRRHDLQRRRADAQSRGRRHRRSLRDGD